MWVFNKKKKNNLNIYLSVYCNGLGNNLILDRNLSSVKKKFFFIYLIFIDPINRCSESNRQMSQLPMSPISRDPYVLCY